MTIKWMLETLKVVKNWIVKIVKKKMKFFLKYDEDDREYGLLLECQDEQLGKIRY